MFGVSILKEKDRKGVMHHLECEKCKSYLTLNPKRLELSSDNKKIIFKNVPILECKNCKFIKIPDIIKLILKDIFGTEYEYIRSNINSDSINKTNEFDFNKVIRKYCNDSFIDNKNEIKFLYDRNDYYFLPGLLRKWNIGFLAPVFFNIEVLNKYRTLPEYKLDLFSESYGFIEKNGSFKIYFGINENNKVIMWLGDILELDIREQYHLKSENIKSDHSINSEFYKAQIEVEWSQFSNDRRLLMLKNEFSEKIKELYDFDIFQLNNETEKISENVLKILYNTKDEFESLINKLNKILIEGINVKNIQNFLIKNKIVTKKEIENTRGIKLLEFFLDEKMKKINVNKEISPLFVLYDLRISQLHLCSEERYNNKIEYALERLDLEKKNNLKNYNLIAKILIKKLNEMYEKFIINLEWL